MEVVETLTTAARIADTIHKFATHDWNKKTLIQLTVASCVFIGIAYTIKRIDTKHKEGKNNG